LFESCYKHAFYDTNVSDLSCIVPLTVEQIDNCVKQLKYGKDAGPDGLTAEHLKYAHPALVVHLKLLMAMSLKPLAAVLLFHYLRTNWVITTRLRITPVQTDDLQFGFLAVQMLYLPLVMLLNILHVMVLNGKCSITRY